LAAGALLITETGGTISDGLGQELLFNRREPRYRGIIATGPHCPEALARQLTGLTCGTDNGLA